MSDYGKCFSSSYGRKMRFVVFFVLRVFFRIFYRIEVKGLDNIPSHGPLIVASNHNSNADPPVLMSLLALKRKANILAKKELFHPSIIGKVFSYFGAIAVDRKTPGADISALRAGLAVLREGGCLVIFPQGTRAAGRKVYPKGGVAFLAARSKAQVLPVRIFNTENFLKLGRIVVVFGKPVSQTVLSSSKDYQEASGIIMEEIFSLKAEI